MALTDYVFVAVGARDLAAADAALEELRVKAAVPSEQVDAVSIGRKRNGERRFHREALDPTNGAARVSIAAGLAAALYPSVGGDMPASRVADRAALHAVAGRIADALGRPTLMEFGELLDDWPAAVIAAAPDADRDILVGALADTGSPAVRTSALDDVVLERVAAVARTAASRGEAG